VRVAWHPERETNVQDEIRLSPTFYTASLLSESPSSEFIYAMKNIKCIKGSTLQNNIMGPIGYIIIDNANASYEDVMFSIKPAANSAFSFVFGFRGVGNHFCLDYRPEDQRFILARYLDGMRVYLHHAYFDFPANDSIDLVWNDHSIRLYGGKTCFLNILSDGLADGDYGFHGIGRPSIIPELHVSTRSSRPYEWIILGDGYSNNRWKNRDFFSWPEIAFGDKINYLNACVAAGNTLRVIDIIERLKHRIPSTRVILAVGSDDIIESNALDLVKERLKEIAERLRVLGAAKVYLTTLPAKPKLGDKCRLLNEWILNEFNNDTNETLDFQGVLAEMPGHGLVKQDYPSANAHLKIAQLILDRFFPGSALVDFKSKAPHIENNTASRFSYRMADRLAYKINRYLDRIE
jgi:hypothetical protein